MRVLGFSSRLRSLRLTVEGAGMETSNHSEICPESFNMLDDLV